MNTTQIKAALALLAGIFVSHSTARAALLEHFKLDEGAIDPTTNTIYSAVSTNTGTFVTGATYAPVWVTTDLAPVPGGALSAVFFDNTATGNEPYILTTAPSVTGTNARTIAAWIRLPAGPFVNAPSIFSSGPSSTGNRFSVRVNETTGGTTGGLRLEAQGGAIVGRTDLRDGKWHHIAVVKVAGGGPTDSVTLYVDGNDDGVSFRSSGNPTINTLVNADNQRFAIGNIPFSAGNYGYPGSVDDVRIYDTALSQSEILEIIYGSGNPPVISQDPQPQAAVLGDTNATASFTVSFTGSPTIYYQWRHAGTNLPAATSQALTVGPNLTPAHLGGYQVLISNAWGTVTSAVANLAWTTRPIDPLRQAAVAGQGAVFNLSMPAYQSYTYQWQQAGIDIPGATRSTYTRSGLVLADATNYTVRVTLDGQVATSPPASISVFSTTSSAYANLVLEDNPIAFWRLGEANGAAVAVDAAGFHSGGYSNYGGYELGMPGAPLNEADTASLFTGLNFIEVPYSATLARTNSITLEAWVNPSAATGRQSIMGSRSSFISRGYELCANGAAWEFRTGTSSDSTAEFWNDLDGGTVTVGQWTHVAATYDGATKRLYVNGSLVGSQTIGVLTAPLPWRLGADATYQVAAANFLNGTLDELAIYWRCMTSDQVRDHYNMGVLGAGVRPTFVTQPVSQQVVIGDTNAVVTFSATVSGSPRLRFQWRQGTSALAGQNASALVITPVTAAALGTYSVAVSNNAGNILSTNATLSYVTAPISPSAQVAIVGAPATISLPGMPTYQPYTYQWKHAGTNLPGATGAVLTIPAATDSDVGDYSVVVTLGSDSVESGTATIAVAPLPTQTYAAEVAADTPVGWWKLDEPPGSSTAANAVTAGADDGYVSPDATLGAEGALLGSTGTAASFTGYSIGGRAGQSQIEVYQNAALNPSVFSVECWALARGGAGTYRSPVTSRNSGTGLAEGYLFYAGTDNRWQFWLGNGTGWSTLVGPAVVENQWAHLVGTYNGTTASFYVNGAKVAELATAFVPNTTYGLRIGGGATEVTPGNYYFPGRVDEVAVYNRALAADRVQFHYTAAFQPNSAPRFTLAPFGRATIAGEPFQFSARVHAAAPLTLHWQKGGSNVAGATNADLAITSVTAADSGSYQLAATSGTASATSAAAALEVLTGEAVSFNLLGFSTPTIAGNGGRAGLVQVGNWNEAGYSAISGSVSGLVNHKGATTSMGAAWSGANYRRWNGPFGAPDGDYAMLSGFIEQTSAPASITLDNIPAAYQSAGYSLYVYMGAPNATVGQVTAANWFGAVRVGTATNFYHSLDMAFWDGRFVRATNTDPLDASVKDANYALFTGLNSGTVTVYVEPHPAASGGPFSISAVQLLANVVTAAPVPIQVERQGNDIILTWPGTWILQKSPVLDAGPGGWSDVTGATSPYPLPQPLESQQYYRLRTP